MCIYLFYTVMACLADPEVVYVSYALSEPAIPGVDPPPTLAVHPAHGRDEPQAVTKFIIVTCTKFN